MMRRKSPAFVGVALLVLAGVALMFGRSETRRASEPTVVAAATNGTSRILAPQVANARSAVAPASEAPLSSRGTKTVRITADRTMTAALRAALSELGARVIAPIGARAVIVEVTPESCRRISADSLFMAEDVLPAAKVQETLAEMCAAKKESTVPISVVGLAPSDRAALSAWVVSEGGSLRQGPDLPGVLYAEIPTDLVASLAERGDVRWIEYCPDYKLFNDCSVVESAANVDAVRSVHKLRGRGQTVAIYDSGFDTGDKGSCHLDFSGRVKEVVNEMYTKADYMGHGTHCAGTILGDGTRSDGRYKGMAPEAQLFAQSAGDTAGSTAIYLPGTAEHIFASCLGYDAYIHSDSWGSDTKGEYTTMCSGLDGVMWDHPELLVVVACGNDGYNGMGTVGSPAAAKNALTVGNSYSTRRGDNPENLNVSSSRGPTKDARIKPEIVAPGTRIFSARSSRCSQSPISGNAYYTEMTGTSMATPLVSGAAALVRQWLADRRDYTNALPSSALVKAILMGGGTAMSGSCSAEAIPTTLPNNYIGWGRLNLEKTLYPTGGCAVKFVDRIPFHDGVTETINLTTTNAAPLDIQLCWIDYAADASAAHTLINDLDLIVSNKTTGAVWYGNAVTDGDHTNTAESVRIPLAAADDYAIHVKGYAVPHDSTEGGAAAVYIRGAFEDETKPDPEYIRNVRTGVTYEFLDEAIGEVAAGDTLEILNPVELKKTVTVAASCTIVSTNGDPKATCVTRRDGAALTVAAGATLTLTNIAFAASDATLVSVSAGANVTLCTNVTLGVDRAYVAIETADAAGFTLAGPLESTILFHCAAARAEPAVFGSYSCDLSVAEAAAAKIICADDSDRETRGRAESGQLLWKVTSVPVEESTGYFVDENGTTNAYARIDRAFERYAARVAAGETLPEIVIREALDPTQRVLTRTVVVANNLTLRGETSAATIALEGEASFSLPTATTLTLTNLVVSGTAVKIADCASKVTGGDLTLAGGAMLRSLANKYQYGNKPWGGAIAVTAGTVTMLSGSRIENCAAHSGAVGGGAIYLGSKTATANLFGGTITGCSAPVGGAVYAWGNSTTGACVNIKGDFVAKGNTIPDGSKSSNVFLGYNAILTIPDYLLPAGSKWTVGLSFGKMSGKPSKDVAGQQFTARCNGSLPTGGEDTANHLFSDSNSDLQGCYVGGSGDYYFRWMRVYSDGQVEPSAAHVVVRVDGETEDRYYATLNDAFGYVTDDATFRLVSDDLISKDVEVTGKVRLIGNDVNRLALRASDAVIHVAPGGSLSVSNITVFCASYYGFSVATKSIFSVEGGALNLERDATIGGIIGTGSRAVNAISVCNGGTFTMLSGSRVSHSSNSYSNPAEATGCGGGVLADRSTLYLRGGSISSSKASRGGGLYVANGSAAYVSGDFTATNNCDLTGALNNVIVSKNSQLIMDGEFTGSIGYNEGIAGDTNWFGTVTWDWPSVEALTNSAARFVHDKTGAHGVAVTNGVDKMAVLVWSDWITRAGKYVSSDGDVYRVCLAPGQSVVVPSVFSVAPQKTADGRSVLSLEGGVEGCWYTVYSTADLAQPFVAETCVQLKAGESFEYEIDPTAASKFYKVIAEEGVK